MDAETLINLLLVLLGTALPPALALALPRKKTVQYGMALNRFIGALFLQKRTWKFPAAKSLWQKIGLTLQSTFQDLAFGVYISARVDLTKEERARKIEEYLEPGKPEAKEIIKPENPAAKDSTAN